MPGYLTEASRLIRYCFFVLVVMAFFRIVAFQLFSFKSIIISVQRKNHSNPTFSERTDILSERLGVSLRDLAPLIGISQAMLFGYRTGKYSPSNKAFGKLLALESSIKSHLPTSDMPTENQSENTEQNQSMGAVDAMQAAAEARAVARREAALAGGLEEKLERTVAHIGAALRSWPSVNAATRGLIRQEIDRQIDDYAAWCETIGKPNQPPES